MTVLVERYAEQHRALWDAFVDTSKNGTFLFRRDYMDYHGDRFPDHSLIICDEGRPVALMPAHADETRLVSHAGLTYGGLITDARMTTPLMLRIFDALLTHCRAQGFVALRYKAIPHIYHRAPAEEDLYALQLAGGRVARRSVISVVDGRERLNFQERRQRGIRKARRNGLRACPSDNLAEYWRMLTENLRQRHNTQPTHTLAEIARLQRVFPANIRLYGCFEGEKLLAGVLIYESTQVARAQYIAASPYGRGSGALDLLFDHLINDVFADKPYFDFGTSQTPTTHHLNIGLIEQKEGFGARAIVHDTYEIDLSHRAPAALGEMPL